MNTIAKWAIATPAAGILTLGVFFGMIGLIAGEWTPQEKAKNTKFEINPVVEDIKVIVSKTKLAKLEKVETPPPPVRIEIQTAAKPTEPIAKEIGAIPIFKKPKPNPRDFVIEISDRDAQPLVRILPITPSRFLEGNYSGHCRVRFDVSAEGSPFNIQAISCTASILQSATIKSIQKWRFNPKVVDGRNVAMRGVENKVTFQLLDERGNLLPEPGL